MAGIFAVLENEALVQEGDKTRLDARKSFQVSGAALTKIEIKPSAADAYYDVTATGYLDWVYARTTMDDPQTLAISLKVTGDAAATQTIAGSIQVVSEATDGLWSKDSDLVSHEPDILRYVRDGRATFKDVHRRAQTLMLAWMDKEGFIDTRLQKFTKANFVNPDEMAEWSKFVALRLIFGGLVNAKDDHFAVKAQEYLEAEREARSRAVVRMDVDNDGTASIGEGITISGGIVVRR